MYKLPVQSDAEDAAWRWQLAHAITDLDRLERFLTLTDDERSGVERALTGGFPLSITPYYADLIAKDDPRCPIRRQCIPLASEAVEVVGDLRDPLGEEDNEVAPHLVQRYPDRALLIATDRCSVYCRFCTRSRMVGNGGGTRSLDKLAPAFAYLRAHPEVQEVIVSGGDPLVMKSERIAALLSELAWMVEVRHQPHAWMCAQGLAQRWRDPLRQRDRRA
jgi:lysine 2,3-aminomutase